MRSALFIAAMLFGVFSAQSQTVELTLRVDMSEFTGTIDTSGMHVAGNFPTGTWTPSERPMTDEGGGIWSYTETIASGYALEYKFVLGNDWPFGDENVGGLSCAAPGTSNRSLITPAADEVLPAVCWNSCNECAFVAPTTDVTFQVDMSLQTIDFDNGGPGISGSFNDFSFEPLTDQGDGIYATTITLDEGTTAQYKFRNGGAFENPFGPCASGDFGNRVLEVPSDDTVLDAVCYASCEACTTPGAFYDVTFRVDASQLDVDSAGIHIAGSFNGFTPTQMTAEGGGIYSIVYELEENSEYIWKYLNGNSFDNVETVPEACGSDDGFGGFNRTFTAPAEDTVLDLVCFGSCTSECVAAPCEAEGGTLTAVSPRSVCVGTGSAQGVDVQVADAVGTNDRWGLIAADGTILDTRNSNSLFNLDVYPPGDYTIRYISYEDDVSLSGLTNASQLSNLEGCWDASNPITVFLRAQPDGGTLTALSPTTICAAAGSQTGVQVELTGASGENSRFGVVNVGAAGNPIVSTQNGTTFNLNSLSAGTYQIRHLSYQNGVNVSGVETQNDLAGCFDISNGVSVTIVNCSASIESSPNPTHGPSFVTFTNQMEGYATVEVYDLSGRLVEQIFNQVTVPGQPYRLQFDGSGLPNGVYLYRLTTESETITEKFMIAR